MVYNLHHSNQQRDNVMKTINEKYFNYLKTLSIPEDHSYIAMSPTGKVYAYRYKPGLFKVMFGCDGVYIGKYDPKSIDWTKSVIDIESLHKLFILQKLSRWL